MTFDKNPEEAADFMSAVPASRLRIGDHLLMLNGRHYTVKRIVLNPDDVTIWYSPKEWTSFHFSATVPHSYLFMVIGKELRKENV